ncbi:hypothetical protein EVAR_44077_1 [Eumeta japonica]|uniref:Uncharacterized protein n=1 Tax=Eumeta variegata TaxID=151549 RepID=A0A4C1X2D2_EUMVA|nr:hypothetical protein EVAR_44077_1 [Eumeta japonica]
MVIRCNPRKRDVKRRGRGTRLPPGRPQSRANNRSNGGSSKQLCGYCRALQRHTKNKAVRCNLAYPLHRAGIRRSADLAVLFNV